MRRAARPRCGAPLIQATVLSIFIALCLTLLVALSFQVCCRSPGIPCCTVFPIIRDYSGIEGLALAASTWLPPQQGFVQICCCECLALGEGCLLLNVFV